MGLSCKFFPLNQSNDLRDFRGFSWEMGKSKWNKHGEIHQRSRKKWRFLAGKIIEPGNLWDFHVDLIGFTGIYGVVGLDYEKNMNGIRYMGS